MTRLALCTFKLKRKEGLRAGFPVSCLAVQTQCEVWKGGRDTRHDLAKSPSAKSWNESSVLDLDDQDLLGWKRRLQVTDMTRQMHLQSLTHSRRFKENNPKQTTESNNEVTTGKTALGTSSNSGVRR